MHKLPTTGRSRRWAKKYTGRAFSLVEVVLALGIASFALVILIALLPVGLQANRESQQESTTVNLVNALIADLKDSPKTNPTYTYQLPPVIDVAATTGSTQAAAGVTNGIKEDLTITATNNASARFIAAVTRQQLDTNTCNPVIYTISVTPAPQAANATRQGIVETSVAIPQQ